MKQSAPKMDSFEPREGEVVGGQVDVQLPSSDEISEALGIVGPHPTPKETEMSEMVRQLKTAEAAPRQKGDSVVDADRLIDQTKQEMAQDEGPESTESMREQRDHYRRLLGQQGNQLGDIRAEREKEREELLQRIARLEGQQASGSNAQRTPNMTDVKEALYGGVDATDPFYDHQVQAFMRFSDLMGAGVQQMVNSVQEQNQNLQGEVKELKAMLSNKDVTPDFAEQYLSEHPELRNLSPDARMAVLSDLAKVRKGPLQREVPRPNPAEHVESSDRSVTRETSSDAVMRKYDTMDTKDQGTFLSQWVKAHGSGGLF
jgi:hypothetical protein